MNDAIGNRSNFNKIWTTILASQIPENKDLFKCLVLKYFTKRRMIETKSMCAKF